MQQTACSNRRFLPINDDVARWLAGGRRLKRAEIVRALSRPGELCAARHDKVELAIYGGTVRMFAYDCRAATKDIDAILHPPEVVAPRGAQANNRRLARPWFALPYAWARGCLPGSCRGSCRESRKERSNSAL